MLLCTTEGDAEREEQYLTLLREAGRRRPRRRAPLATRPDRRVREGRLSDRLPRPRRRLGLDSARPGGQPARRTARDRAPDRRSVTPRIGTVTGAQVLGISDERLAGYWEALVNAGIKLTRGSSPRATSQRRAGTRRARALLEASPDVTAIFAANDLSALGVLHALAKRPPRARRRLCRRLRRPSALRIHRHRR